MTGKANGNSNRPRRRKSASTEYAPGLNKEYREAAEIGRDRQAKAEDAEEEAKKAAAEAKAIRYFVARARGQMRNARAELGEAVQLFQLRYPDRVPADDANALAKPLALALQLFTTSIATAKGKALSAEQVASHVARHLRGLLPLASSSAIARATDFWPYLVNGEWPNVHERSAMLRVTAAECDAIGARHLKPTDLSPEQMRERKNRMQRERDAQRTPRRRRRAMQGIGPTGPRSALSASPAAPPLLSSACRPSVGR